MIDACKAQWLDRRPLSVFRQDLAARYMPMARSLARPRKRSWPGSADDFDSAAMLALVEAAEAYDATRGVKFSTFARHRILGALRDAQRRLTLKGWKLEGGQKMRPRLVSLVSTAEQHGRLVSSHLSDPPVGTELEATDEVERWLKKLPKRHAEVCREIYLNGCSQSEAARRVGCSQSRLSYVHREAIAMLNGTWKGRPTPTGKEEDSWEVETEQEQVQAVCA